MSRRTLVVIAKALKKVDPQGHEAERAAADVARVLEEHGYRVDTLTGNGITEVEFHLSLREAMNKGEPYSIVFIVAHGSEEGLHDSVHSPHPFAGKDSFRAMHRGLLCFISCSMDGKLCRGILSTRSFIERGADAVKAIFSYQPRFGVFPNRMTKELQTRQREALKYVVSSHAEAIARGGTMEVIRERMVRSWSNAAAMLRAEDREYRLMYFYMMRCLILHGDASCSLEV